VSVCKAVVVESLTEIRVARRRSAVLDRSLLPIVRWKILLERREHFGLFMTAVVEQTHFSTRATSAAGALTTGRPAPAISR
jgi:hypothetical protein